jgi:hypothetical protein
MIDDNKRFPPESWSIEPVADFGFYLNRELPTYEDEDGLECDIGQVDEDEPPGPPRS